MIKFHTLREGEMFLYDGEVCIKIEPIRVQDKKGFTLPINFTINYYGLETGTYGQLCTHDDVLTLNNHSKESIVLNSKYKIGRL